MARAPAAKDWTAIRLAQMRDAGKKFGDFEKPAPNAKLLPHMDAAYAREILKYWYTTSADLLERSKTKVGASRIRLTKAVDAYRAAMQPFAATVLVDVATDVATDGGASLLMTYEASLKFWDATQALTSALAASEWAPDRSDLWWQSVAEAANDVKKKVAEVLDTGASWGFVALLVIGGALLLGGGNSKDNRA